MHHGYMPIFIHTPGWARSPTAGASGAVSRGGFGRTGGVMTGTS
jgi:hypothetical protein